MPPRSAKQQNGSPAKPQRREYKCTACEKIIKSSYDAKLHPLIGCLICRKCCLTYADGDFAANFEEGVDESGDDNYCRWCCDGGELNVCMNDRGDGRRCGYSFCKECIQRNVPDDIILTYDTLTQEEKDRLTWLCYGCDHSNVAHLQREAAEAMKDLIKRSERKSANESPSQEQPTRPLSTRRSRDAESSATSTTPLPGSSETQASATEDTAPAPSSQNDVASNGIEKEPSPTISSSTTSNSKPSDLPKSTPKEPETKSNPPQTMIPPQNAPTQPKKRESELKATSAIAAASTTTASTKPTATISAPKKAEVTNEKAKAPPISQSTITPKKNEAEAKAATVASTTAPESVSKKRDITEIGANSSTKEPSAKKREDEPKNSANLPFSNPAVKKRKFDDNGAKQQTNGSSQPTKRRETSEIPPRIAPSTEIFAPKRRETVSFASKIDSLRNQAVKKAEEEPKIMAATPIVTPKQTESVENGTKDSPTVPASPARSRETISNGLKITVSVPSSASKRREATDVTTKTSTVQLESNGKKAELNDQRSVSTIPLSSQPIKTVPIPEKRTNGVSSGPLQRLQIYKQTKDFCIEEIHSKFENVVEMMNTKGLSKKVIVNEIESMSKPIQEILTMLDDMKNLQL